MIDASPPDADGNPKAAAAAFVALLLTLCIVTGVALRIQPARAVQARGCGSRTVALLGDSITDQARGVMADTLSGYEVAVEATAGRKIHEQLDAAREVAKRRPDRVVINLGSNDVLLHEAPDVSLRSLREMVGIFPAQTCLHLVTINESFFAGFPDGPALQREARAINDEIRKIAAERNHSVIDWAQVVSDSSRAVPPEVITADTVHPNDLGKQKLANSYRESLEQRRP